jgi:hypothetical protein
MANFSSLAPTVHIVRIKAENGLMKRAIYTKTSKPPFNTQLSSTPEIATGFPKVMIRLYR